MGNHLTLGIYPNGDYKYNVVRDDDLKDHIEYNKRLRPGRMLYVDGVCVHEGLMPTEVTEHCHFVAKEFYVTKSVNMSQPTIPYR